MKNIVLFGFMGTGKTSVGKKLAGDLKMKFVEMDSVIREREKKSINRIFSEKGEEYFRRLERNLVKKISKKTDTVVSTGGGVVLNPDNVKDLKKNGVLFCFNASPKEIFKRIKKTKRRPLLNVINPLKKIKILLEYRRPYYDKVEIQIDTDGKSIDEVADEVSKKYENYKSKLKKK